MTSDVFRVAYDPGRVSPGEIFRVIRKQGFEPGVPEGDALAHQSQRSRAKDVQRDLKGLPADVRKTFDAAARAGRAVLLAFHEPG